MFDPKSVANGYIAPEMVDYDNTHHRDLSGRWVIQFESDEERLEHRHKVQGSCNNYYADDSDTPYWLVFKQSDQADLDEFA